MIRNIVMFSVLGVVGLGVVGALGLFFAARSASRPANLGVTNGQLAVCPATPNCVSTQTGNATQVMPPLNYTGTSAEARERLMQIIRAQPRVEVLEETPTYVATVFRSATMQFPDDVEFLFDEQASVIHFRSASRLGESDMGVNRARMTAISEQFAAQP